MTLPAVVMAAGLGTRLRPLTERWAKAVLPVDGRPVVATLLRELAAAGCPRATVVVGHLGGQVERLLAGDGAFGLELRFARQPAPAGSADAVLRTGEQAPFLAVAADTVFRPGDVGRFVEAFLDAGAAGAVAVRRHPEKHAVAVADGRVVRVHDPGGPGPLTAAPLWALGPPVAGRLGGVPGPPYELKDAFQQAIDAGEPVLAVEIGPTRDLTDPLDLVEENFPYLR